MIRTNLFPVLILCLTVIFSEIQSVHMDISADESDSRPRKKGRVSKSSNSIQEPLQHQKQLLEEKAFLVEEKLKDFKRIYLTDPSLQTRLLNAIRASDEYSDDHKVIVKYLESKKRSGFKPVLKALAALAEAKQWESLALICLSDVAVQRPFVLNQVLDLFDSLPRLDQQKFYTRLYIFGLAWGFAKDLQSLMLRMTTKVTFDKRARFYVKSQEYVIQRLEQYQRILVDYESRRKIWELEQESQVSKFKVEDQDHEMSHDSRPVNVKDDLHSKDTGETQKDLYTPLENFIKIEEEMGVDVPLLYSQRFASEAAARRHSLFHVHPHI